MNYLDTHVVMWLFQHDRALSSRAAELIAVSTPRISPTVVLELTYMHEIGRALAPAADVLASLHAELGLQVCDLPFPLVVNAAIPLTWTRDPFDRLIVAQAIAGRGQLVTKDDLILRHFDGAVW